METNILNPLNTLIVEDQTDDLELILFELGRQGIQVNWNRVDNEADYLAQLHPGLDLILADYHMPQFSAIRALELLQARGLTIPFIVITGSISEEVAVECMKLGAVDYLLKDRLSRLGPAIHQAMRERRLSLEKQRTEEALRDSEIKFKTLFTESLDVILIINSETGIVLDVNKTLQRALGFAPHQLVGKHYSTLIPPLSEAQRSEDLIDAVRHHGAVFESRGFMRADGTICPMDITATVIPWGSGTAVVATLRDVSERMQAQEAQQTAEMLKMQLEHEKELNELKSRFVSMVSHEYRTPLATIMTSSELLLHYAGRMTEENRMRHLTQIQQSVKNMLNLMNEVLTLEKMNLSQLHFEPKSLDLTEFCTAVVDEITFNTQGVIPIEFTITGESRMVCVDETLMRQIVSNLLSNAVKYSPEGSTVDFRLDWGTDRVMLTVSDHGIGIPEEDQKRLFEPFHRARNVSGISGTGLGLSIAKRAVELHGGTLGFQSQVGIGTTFVVIIPINSESKCA